MSISDRCCPFFYVFIEIILSLLQRSLPGILQRSEIGILQRSEHGVLHRSGLGVLQKKSALGYRLCFGKTGCLKHFLAEKVIECEDAASNADHGSQGADADAYDTAGSHHADAAGNGYAGDVDEVFAEAQITSAPFADNLGQTVGWIGDQLHIDAHGNADACHYDGDNQHDKTCRERWNRQSQTLQEKVKTCIKELQEQAEGHGKRQLQPVGPLS